MSTTSSLSSGREAASAGVPGAVGYTLRRWWLAYTAWRAECRAVRCLYALSDRQLKDIGIVRSEIEWCVKSRERRE